MPNSPSLSDVFRDAVDRIDLPPEIESHETGIELDPLTDWDPGTPDLRSEFEAAVAGPLPVLETDPNIFGGSVLTQAELDHLLGLLDTPKYTLELRPGGVLEQRVHTEVSAEVRNRITEIQTGLREANENFTEQFARASQNVPVAEVQTGAQTDLPGPNPGLSFPPEVEPETVVTDAHLDLPGDDAGLVASPIELPFADEAAAEAFAEQHVSAVEANPLSAEFETGHDWVHEVYADAPRVDLGAEQDVTANVDLDISPDSDP